MQTSVRGWKEFAYFNQMPFRKKINTVSRIKHQCEHIRVLAQTHHSLRSSLREAGAGLLLVIRRRLLLLVALATELAEVQRLDGVDRRGVSSCSSQHCLPATPSPTPGTCTASVPVVRRQRPPTIAPILTHPRPRAPLCSRALCSCVHCARRRSMLNGRGAGGPKKRSVVFMNRIMSLS